MKLDFLKYQGTGNDFVMIDNRQHQFGNYDAKKIAFLCNRRFGIGGDGLILLEEHNKLDFKMVYFNSDGNQSSMCGNGGRCIVAFAKYLGIINSKTSFDAIDGTHNAKIEKELVHLQMQDVENIEDHKSHTFLNTGSPHHVQLENDLKAINIKTEGAKIRFGQPYGSKGTNVNFVSKITENKFAVRTYERGVEDETLSCGTGVTAVALAMNFIGETENNLINLQTRGGELQVAFNRTDNSFTNIWLIGTATQVFKGTIEWKH